VENSSRDGNTRPPYLSPEKKELCVRLVGATIIEKKCEVSSKQLKIEPIHDLAIAIMDINPKKQKQ